MQSCIQDQTALFIAVRANQAKGLPHHVEGDCHGTLATSVSQGSLQILTPNQIRQGDR